MNSVRLGICMEGLEEFFKTQVLSTRTTPFDTWTYLEIGVAAAQTLNGISVCAAEYDSPWRCIGVDLPNGWSLDRWHIGKYYPHFVIRKDVPVELPESGTTIFLTGGEAFLKAFKSPVFDAVFIDGCHERECAAHDFNMIEPLVKPGGVVIFHDAGQNQQGGDPQPHRGKPIEVYNALGDLGLLSESRPGWSKLDWCQGEVAAAAATRRIA